MNKITIVAPTQVQNKVTAIKAIRCLTGLGLKEAKDASEFAGIACTYDLVLNLPDKEYDEQCRILRNEGFEVGGPIHLMLDQMREIATQALRQGEDEFANEILQLILVEKLRRKNP